MAYFLTTVANPEGALSSRSPMECRLEVDICQVHQEVLHLATSIEIQDQALCLWHNRARTYRSALRLQLMNT